MKKDLYHKLINIPIYEIDVDIIFTKDVSLAENYIDETFPGLGYVPSMDNRGASLLIQREDMPAQVLVIINVEGNRSDFDVTNDILVQGSHVAWIVSDLLGHSPTLDSHTGHSHVIKFMFNRMREVWADAVTESDIKDL